VQAGRNPNELACEFGCHATSILSGLRKARLGAPVPDASSFKPLSPNERKELIELRRKVRQLQMQRDILSQATAWFAG
jgi:transposase